LLVFEEMPLLQGAALAVAPKMNTPSKIQVLALRVIGPNDKARKSDMLALDES